MNSLDNTILKIKKYLHKRGINKNNVYLLPNKR